MQEKFKYVLRKGKVICTIALISIASIPCKKTSVDDYDVFVMSPKLLSNINIDSIEIEEVAFKNVNDEVIAMATPTVVPTPTLTPEQEEIQKYEGHFRLFDYCYIEDNHDRYIAYFKENPNMSALDAITYVNIGLDNDYYTNVTNIVNPSSPLVICNKYNKLPNDYVPEGFSKDTKKTTVLHGDAGEAYEKMVGSAKEDGLRIYSISSYRSYNYQEDRYNAKVRARGQADVDKTNARPGNSEHQTALAVDFSNGNDKYDLVESFAETKEGKWLANNAHKFGYILRYPKGKEVITGYNYEPWHFRYVGVNIAKAIMKTGLTYDEFYARYILPVFTKYPEASYLSGDEFYNKYLEPIYKFGQVCMDDELINDTNGSLVSTGDNNAALPTDNCIEEDKEKILVLLNR